MINKEWPKEAMQALNDYVELQRQFDYKRELDHQQAIIGAKFECKMKEFRWDTQPYDLADKAQELLEYCETHCKHILSNGNVYLYDLNHATLVKLMFGEYFDVSEL